jgi:DNA-binding SARP family transcriptional activator
MRLRILGESVIELRDREYTPTAPHFFALLLRLAADSGRFFQRQELAHLLFPAAPSERAATHSVRQLVYQALQRGALLDKSGGAVALNQTSLSVDIEDALLHDQSHEPARHRALMVLPGYAPSLSEGFDEWLESYRAHQQTRIRHALLAAVQTLRQRADWRAVEARAIECLSLDPFNEPATLALAEALARTGSKERAVTLLEQYKNEVTARDAAIAIPATLLRRRIESSVGLDSPAHVRVPLIGRGDAMASLHDQWRRAAVGQLHFTLVRGEPGVGKSRLLEEFAEAVRLTGRSSVLMVRKSTPERFRPFAFFADLMPHLLRLPGSAGRDPRLMPFLHRLEGGPSESAAVSLPGEAQFVSAGINSAVVDLLASIGEERSAVVFVDDSRAIDEVSLALMADLKDAPSTLPMLFIVACDDSDQRDAVSRLATDTLTLKPLPESVSRELLVQLMSGPNDSPPESAIQWGAAVAAGNPAFLHLLAAHSTAFPGSLDVPRDILAAVDRRLELLSPEASRVLEACAVLGDHCDALLLEEVVGLAAFSVVSALHELERAGLIDCLGEHVLLRSALFRQRTLLSASASVIALLHSRSARAMEGRLPSANSSWRIASHWHSAGQHRRARATLAASWRKSLQLGQPLHAHESIREYLSLTTDASERIGLYNDLIEVTQAAGDSAATISAIDERAALLRTTGSEDVHQEAFSSDRLDAQLQSHANPSAPETDLMAFMYSPSLDTVRRVRAAQRLMASADATANPALAAAVHDALHDFDTSDLTAKAFYNQSLLIYHSVFGDATHALSIAQTIIAIAKREPYSWPNIRGQVNASLALRLVGTSNDSLDHLEALHAELVAMGAVPLSVLVASRAASFLLDDGDVASARRWVRRADSARGNRTLSWLPAEYISVQTDLALVAGDLDRAERLIATMRDAAPLYEAPRFRMELMSYALRLAQYAGDATSESDVDELLAWHLRARSYGRHDDNMDALWVALVQQGKAVLASELLGDYLRVHRRELRPCSYFLRVRTASDPAWPTRLSANDASLALDGRRTHA